MQSVQLSVTIERPASEVYAFAADPAAMPQWAAGLSSSPQTTLPCSPTSPPSRE